MLKHIYYPLLFQIGPIKIFTWGFIVAIGILLAILLATKYAKKKDINPDQIQNLIILMVIGGILGSRLIHILQFPEIPLTDFFKIWDGGLSLFGGLLGGTLVFYIYAKHKKLNFLKTLDILAIPMVLGLLIGRIACFFGDGGHIGKLTTVSWGVLVNGEIRHWTVLYSFIILIPILIILLKLKTKHRYDGFLLASTMILYGIGRFILDFFRADPTYLGLTIAQFGTILIFILGVYLIYKNAIKD